MTQSRKAIDSCPFCGFRLSAAEWLCPTCQNQVAPPNVRRCNTRENRHLLASRLKGARDAIIAATDRSTLANLWKAFQNSRVVLTLTAGTFLSMVADPKTIYSNYEKLVAGDTIRPRKLGNDLHRHGVSGTFFGSYADQILYGALSLTDEGCPTYGEVFCSLKPITVRNRTSFLETNSYKFVEDHKILAGGQIPNGHWACWNHRKALALIKVAPEIKAGQTVKDWQGFVISSDGKAKSGDDYIEAHIFGKLTKNSFLSATLVPSKNVSQYKKLDLRTAISGLSYI